MDAYIAVLGSLAYSSLNFGPSRLQLAFVVPQPHHHSRPHVDIASKQMLCMSEEHLIVNLSRYIPAQQSRIPVLRNPRGNIQPSIVELFSLHNIVYSYQTTTTNLERDFQTGLRFFNDKCWIGWRRTECPHAATVFNGGTKMPQGCAPTCSYQKVTTGQRSDFAHKCLRA